MIFPTELYEIIVNKKILLLLNCCPCFLKNTFTFKKSSLPFYPHPQDSTHTGPHKETSGETHTLVHTVGVASPAGLSEMSLQRNSSQRIHPITVGGERREISFLLLAEMKQYELHCLQCVCVCVALTQASSSLISRAPQERFQSSRTL